MLWADAGLELDNLFALDVEVPFEVGAQLPLHLVDLLEGEHILRDNDPGLIRVRVVADDLRRNHECRDEKSVAGWTPGGGVPRL
jgi:hypothetical protein